MAEYFSRRSGMIFGTVITVLIGMYMLPESLMISSRAEAQLPVDSAHDWTLQERNILESLWLGTLPALPADPSNAVADNEAAADFGHKLFFDTRLSENSEVSCASCHQPELLFTDGLPRGRGVGETPRATMPIAGLAYSNWFLWDGRSDSMWAQALGPLENPKEHAGSRNQFAHIVFSDTDYRQQYESIFGSLPDLSDLKRFPPMAGPVEDPDVGAAWASMSAADQDAVNRIFANIGKAIAAFERQISYMPSKFDNYVEVILAGGSAEGEHIFNDAEVRGLRLFIGKANCIDCHNGPLLSNHAFHNTGVPPAADLPPDLGRLDGITLAIADPFNCTGAYSDATARDCVHLRFARTEGQDLVAAFKVPSLRSVNRDSPFFMHSGQFSTLEQVLDHYNQAPAAANGVTELFPLNLDAGELQDLIAFLHTLSAPLVTPTALMDMPSDE